MTSGTPTRFGPAPCWLGRRQPHWIGEGPALKGGAPQRVGGYPILIIVTRFGQPRTMQTMLWATLRVGDPLVLVLDSALHLPGHERPGHPHKHKGDSPDERTAG